MILFDSPYDFNDLDGGISSMYLGLRVTRLGVWKEGYRTGKGLHQRRSGCAAGGDYGGVVMHLSGMQSLYI